MDKEFDLDAEPDLELLEGTSDDEDDQENVIGSQSEEPEVSQEEQKDEEEDQQEEKPKRDPVIPRARFDEVHAKWQQERAERARIEAELAELRKPKQEQAPDETLDLKALRKQAFDARLAENDEEADAIEERIEAERNRRAEAAAEARVAKREQEREAKAAQESAAKQEAEAQAEAAKIVAKHPWLDSTSADGDEEAIESVIALRNQYASKGLSLASALVKAVAVVAKSRGEVDEPVTDTRKQLALVTAAKTAASQPPRTGSGVGNRAVPLGNNILESQSAWEKASEEERMQFLA